MPLASEGNGHRQEESSAMLGARERLAPEPVPPAPTSGAGGAAALRTTDRLVPLAAVVPPAEVDPLPVTKSLVESSGSAGAGALAVTWPARAQTLCPFGTR